MNVATEYQAKIRSCSSVISPTSTLLNPKGPVHGNLGTPGHPTEKPHSSVVRLLNVV